jgi:pimeloyl-ACP methyl ester carboxylesterase
MIADDISELLIKMNINSVYVLGLSSGANSALWLSAKYPKQVMKAVINGANLTTSAETIGEYWNRHHKNLLDSLNLIQFKTEDDKIKLKNIKREYNNMTFEDLHKIQAPTMVISGDYDVIKPSHSVQIFENIKKSYLYIQPSSGHAIAWIYKNEFVKNVDHFFATPFKQFSEKDKSY